MQSEDQYYTSIQKPINTSKITENEMASLSVLPTIHLGASRKYFPMFFICDNNNLTTQIIGTYFLARQNQNFSKNSKNQKCLNKT